MTVRITDRRTHPRGIDSLNMTLYGAHREAQVDDLVLSRDLNRIRILEQGAAGQDPVPIAGTATEAFTPGGARVFGQGADTDDSGLINTTGAPYFSMVTTNETAHIIAIGTDVILQPDTQGPIRQYVRFALPDLSEMSMFFGFVGTAADALDPAVTGATTVLTLVQDDLAGLLMDSGLTDGDGLFFAYNKSNANATIATTDDDVDPSFTIVAGAVYYAAIELDKLGNIAWAIQTAGGGVAASGQRAAALDADEEHAAVFYIQSLDADGTEQADGVAWGLDYYGDNS